MGLLLLQGSAALNPRELFANGEQGAYYDPSVANTLFQLSDGVTAATQPGDPVGLIIDSRKGGLSNLGSDLVTNGTFAADSDWTKGANWTIGSGVATKTGGAANNLTQAIASTAGTWYRLTMDVTRTAGTLTVSLGTSGTTYAISASGSYTFLILAGSSTQTLTLAGDSSFAGTVDNVVARNVPGNHLYQTVSGSRGTLSREPDGGKRNLLTYTEQFDVTTGGWTKNGSTITANAAVAPDGTTTADTLTATAQYGNLNQQSSQSGTTFTFSLYAKKAGSFAELEIGLTSGNNYINGCGALFNLTTGTYTSQRTFGSGYSISSYSISDAGNGWYRLVVTGAISVAAAPFAWAGLGVNSVNGSTMNIWGAQVETGSSATAYQKNTTQYDCTESGKRDCWAIDFDGSDDSYLTSSVDFNTWTQATRRNLLVDTESFGASGWVNNGGTVTENTTTAPDGTTTADTLTRSSGATDGRYQTVTFSGDGTKTVSVYVKAGTAPSLGVWLYDSTAVANRILAAVDMTGATPVIAFVGGAGTSSSVESIGSGWFRLSFVSTSVTAANTNRVYLLPAYGGASANGETSIFWGVQAENSTSVTAYQRVGTDKMTVWAGVFKRSDAAAAIISELSATISGNNGAFWLVGPSAAAADYGFRSKGTSLADCDLANIYAAPRFDVLCGIGDIAADTCKLRLNGVDNSVATDQGSGNYGNYPLYVGRRNNASLPFSGRLYGLIIRGVQTTDSKIREFEKYTARLTGKTI